MQAKDIMTRTVLSVAPDTPVFDVVVLLFGARVSAVSVIADGALVGIVNEADLMRRHELGTERGPAERPWWARLLAAQQWPTGDTKAHAMKVADVMTTAPVSIAEDMPLAEVAALFEARGIGRAPVLSAGKVVGMIDRADLVRAPAAHPLPCDGGAGRNDKACRDQHRTTVAGSPWSC